MSSTDPDEPDSSEELANSGEEQLLRALAAAPRPDASTVLARALSESSPGSAADDGAIPRAGELIDGRYRVDALLGAGGMGVVFAATQLATNRSVAVKWMRPPGGLRSGSERDAAFLRFVREAQMAGRIRHPNVVDVYDAGIDPSAPYLVMEKLEGETLRARMLRGRLGWNEALQLLIPVLRGVSAAHQKSIIHRDLKPDNIFLARDSGGQELPKVLDFGISRLHGEGDRAEPSLTRTGALIGTPAYMPLEQLRGTATDERADVYALGVVLYEMLAGERPYSARNAADFAVLLSSRAPTPLGKHRPDLAGAREAAVMKALERDPEARYANVVAFAEALASPPRHGRRLERRRVLLASLALAGLLAVLLVPRCGQEPRLTPEPLARASRQAAPALPAPPKTTLAPTNAPAANPPPAAVTLAPAPAAPSALPPSPPSPAPAKRPARALAAHPDKNTAAREPPSPTGLRPEDFRAPPSSSTRGSPPRTGQARPTLELGREQF